MLDEHLLSGSRAALHPVDHHHVGARRHGQLHVVVDPSGPHLHVDRNGPIGGLAELLDLDPQVIGTHPVGVAAGRPLVDTGRQRPHGGDPAVDLLPEQHAPAAGLRALSDDDFDRIGLPQIGRVEAITGGEHLVDQ